MKFIGKGIIEKKRGAATNSILLAFVQCITLTTSIVQTMILSRELTETEYGTYSQGMLIVNFILPFLLLGLANAVTYFSSQKSTNKSIYINTIYTLVFILGVVGALGIIVFNGQIQIYFGNRALSSIVPLISFMPLLLNLATIYQTLFIAEDMAMQIAIRNVIVSIIQIGIILISIVLFHNIHYTFLLLLTMYAGQVIIFDRYFRYKKYSVKLHWVKWNNIKNVLRYSLPLALSTAIGTLSVYMDKLLIGRMMSVEDFALYTNMAKELPFSFIISSFTTVLLPALIRMHSMGNDDDLKRYWSMYLELGLFITWILCGTALFCSKELLLVLYSERYARGIGIFVVYLLVELFRFSYFGIILSCFGKTKIIMYSSILSLLSNFILNIVLYNYIGIIGPAIATLCSVMTMQLLQTAFSCKLLKCSCFEIFHFPRIFMLIMEITVLGLVVLKVTSIMPENSYFRLFLCGGVMSTSLFLINRKRIVYLIKEINAI